MVSNYKRLGDYIKPVNIRNTNLKISRLLGVTLDKVFIPSVANTIGTDMTKYKVINKGQFACKLMSVGRDKKLPVSLLKEDDPALISSAYYVFEVEDKGLLLDDYLMMWLQRSETDRFLGFISGGDVRGSISWEDFCSIKINIPSIEKQNAIVKEYNTVVNRIKLNEQLNKKLEETAQAIYKHWFVDFNFPYDFKPNEDGKPYKSGGGKMIWNEVLEKEIPEGWEVKRIKEFTQDMKSGGTPNRGIDEYWNSSDYPWLKTGELKNSVITDSEEYISERGLIESSAKLLPINSVLVAMYGQGETKGQVGYLKIQSSTNQACCAMICQNESRATYLYYHLRVNRDDVVSVAIGGAQPNLSKEIIENVFILDPQKDILENHPFIEILAHREIATKESIALNKAKDLLLSKMSKI